MQASHSVVTISNWILLLHYVAIFCTYAVMFCSHILQSYSVDGIFFPTMLQNTGRFSSRISQQRTMWQDWGQSPHPLICFQLTLPVPSTEISNEEMTLLWCNLHGQECEGRAEKVLTKRFPGNVSSRSAVAGRSVYLHKGTIWRKYSLNDCTVLYFSKMKIFREHFN